MQKINTAGLASLTKVFFKVGLTLSVLCLQPKLAQAQDTQLWTALSINGPIQEDSRVLAWFDGHLRYSEDIGRLGVSIVRPGIGYKLTDSISAWAGYAWIVGQASGQENTTDNRFWQQLTYKLGVSELGNLSGRTRFESRFFRSGGNTGFRLRQSFKLATPITDKIYSSLWNETFFALNSTDFGARSGYDQNRTHVGLGFKLTQSLSTEIGYLFNHIRLREDNADNHNISLALSYKL